MLSLPPPVPHPAQVLEVFDTFCSRYFVTFTVTYIIVKTVHFVVIPDFP